MNEQVAALLQAFGAAGLVIPVYDGDPPTKEEAEAFVAALEQLGYKIVPKDDE